MSRVQQTRVFVSQRISPQMFLIRKAAGSLSLRRRDRSGDVTAGLLLPRPKSVTALKMNIVETAVTKSIVVSKVAEPYAEALLNLAKANDTLKETTNDMNIVSQFLALNSRTCKKFIEVFHIIGILCIHSLSKHIPSKLVCCMV